LFSARQNQASCQVYFATHKVMMARRQLKSQRYVGKTSDIVVCSNIVEHLLVNKIIAARFLKLSSNSLHFDNYL
jgi:hypothetical protein